MGSTAKITTAMAALDVTLYDGDNPLRAIVTREALEAQLGSIGERQADLLTAYERHAGAIETLILERYRKTGRAPVILLGP